MKRIFSFFLRQVPSSKSRSHSHREHFVRPNRKEYERVVRNVIKHNKEALIELGRR